MKILIIEDDINKLENLQVFLKNYTKEKHIEIILTIKNSFQSGISSIIHEKYDLILLDMSLPNFDLDENNDSGDPLSRGGELILYEMDMMDINSKTIIVSQHDEFEGESLEIINKKYLNNFSDFYIGYVFYNAKESNWEKDLEEKIDGVLND